MIEVHTYNINDIISLHATLENAGYIMTFAEYNAVRGLGLGALQLNYYVLQMAPGECLYEYVYVHKDSGLLLVK